MDDRYQPRKGLARRDAGYAPPGRNSRGDDRYAPAEGGSAGRNAGAEGRSAEPDHGAQRTARYSGVYAEPSDRAPWSREPDRIAHYGTQPGGYAQGSGGGAYGIEAGGTQRRLDSLNGHAGRGPKGYQRTDERLHEVISERLTEAPHIDPTEITVTVKNGVVTLDGSVESRATRHAAENLVADCGGVKDIHNNLRIVAPRSTPMMGGEGVEESLYMSDGRNARH